MSIAMPNIFGEKSWEAHNWIFNPVWMPQEQILLSTQPPERLRDFKSDNVKALKITQPYIVEFSTLCVWRLIESVKSWCFDCGGGVLFMEFLPNGWNAFTSWISRCIFEEKMGIDFRVVNYWSAYYEAFWLECDWTQWNMILL